MAATMEAVAAATMATAVSAAGEVFDALSQLKLAPKPAHVGTGQLVTARPGAQKGAGGKKCAGSSRGVRGLGMCAERPG